MTVSIILPTYNECQNIVPLIREIQAELAPLRLDYTIQVVDDNSPDGTGALVQETFRHDPRVQVVIRTTERGLATAIRTGIEATQGEIVVVMDTDFNHDPRVLPQLIEFLKYYDLVIGSRFAQGGGMEDRRRYYLSLIYNLWLRLLLQLQVQDNLSGFMAMRRQQLLTLDLPGIFQGYGEWFIRLIFAACRRKLRILEVPVFYQLRPHGESKSRFVQMLRDYTLTALRLRLQA